MSAFIRPYALPSGGYREVLVQACECDVQRGPQGGVCGACRGAIRGPADGLLSARAKVLVAVLEGATTSSRRWPLDGTGKGPQPTSDAATLDKAYGVRQRQSEEAS